jgi:hypothetical protein
MAYASNDARGRRWRPVKRIEALPSWFAKTRQALEIRERIQKPRKGCLAESLPAIISSAVGLPFMALTIAILVAS